MPRFDKTPPRCPPLRPPRRLFLLSVLATGRDGKLRIPKQYGKITLLEVVGLLSLAGMVALATKCVANVDVASKCRLTVSADVGYITHGSFGICNFITQRARLSWRAFFGFVIT